MKHRGKLQLPDEGNVRLSPPTEGIMGLVRCNVDSAEDDAASIAEDNVEPAESRCPLADVLEVMELTSVRTADVAAVQIDDYRNPSRQDIRNIDNRNGARRRHDPPAAFAVDRQSDARRNAGPPTKEEHSDQLRWQLGVEHGGPEFKDQVINDCSP